MRTTASLAGPSVRPARRSPGLLLALAAAVAASPQVLAQSTPAAKPQVTVSKSATALPGPHYAWVDMPARLEAESDARVQDPQFRQRLQAALDKALQAKGYRPAPAGQADILVAYRVGVRDVEQVDVRETAAAGAGTPQAAIECKAGGCSQLVVRNDSGVPVLKTSVRHETEGGLLIEVLEAGQLRVVWRALERGAVKPGDATQPRLDAIATDVLAELPAAP